MTATEELRRLLDEHGVEHDDVCDMTLWTGVDSRAYIALEMVPLGMKPSKKLMVRQVLTPEQAISETLGPETCHADETERIYISWQDGRRVTIHVMECSACGRTYEHVNGDYEYCPHCGRRIVEVADG